MPSILLLAVVGVLILGASVARIVVAEWRTHHRHHDCSPRVPSQRTPSPGS